MESLKETRNNILGNHITTDTDHISHTRTLQQSKGYTVSYCYKNMDPLLSK